MNIRTVVGGLLTLAVSPLLAAEVDITAAVRAANAGTTALAYGGSYSGYTVDNAFGNLTTMESRVMLSNAYNQIRWTISDDFEAGKPIVVTSYTVRRATFNGSVGDGNDGYSSRRAPSEFYLQASLDGDYWITLDYRKNVAWPMDGTMEQTFELDPKVLAGYRKYRFVPCASTAEQYDVVQCSFQYVKLTGTIGDSETLTRCCRPLEYLFARKEENAVTRFEDITLSFDSRVELDLALVATTGTQAIFTSGRSGKDNKIRLFHTADDGWWYQYGTAEKKTGIKAYSGARYKIVADGPVLTINGVEVANLGEKKTGATGCFFTLLGSTAGDGVELYNQAKGAKVWSAKVYDAAGALVHDLKPVLHADGGARFLDAQTKNLYASVTVTKRHRKDFTSHQWLGDLMPPLTNVTVRLVEGEAFGGVYTVTNAFTSAVSLNDRALFKTKKNVIQYDIHDDYKPGYPIVVARYVIYPCLTAKGSEFYTYNRAPSQFALQASKTGADDGEWVTLSDVSVGFGPGVYNRGGVKVGTSIDGDKTELYGYEAQVVDVPEEKRGDYRHYRFITTGSSASDYDSVKMGFQNIAFHGYCGGFEMAAEPIAYVQNAYEQKNSNNTYFKTGVTPTACDLTIEMTGSFTDVSQTECLFCSRDANMGKTWTLFLINGALRLDCSGAGSASSFKPVVNRVYTIKVEQNKLYVDGKLVYTLGTTNFVPGSEIVLMASHKAATGGWDNQARFKLQSCKILDARGGVIRDYIAAKRSNGTYGLFERGNWSLSSWFCPSAGTAAKGGDPIDLDFRQRERSVAVTSDLERGRLPRQNIAFGFGENQRMPAKLYAALDNDCKGNTTNGWAKVVCLGDVKTGVETLTVEKIPNPNHYTRVKFFVCDDLARSVSHTKTYKTGVGGLSIFVK